MRNSYHMGLIFVLWICMATTISMLLTLYIVVWMSELNWPTTANVAYLYINHISWFSLLRAPARLCRQCVSCPAVARRPVWPCMVPGWQYHNNRSNRGSWGTKSQVNHTLNVLFHYMDNFFNPHQKLYLYCHSLAFPLWVDKIVIWQMIKKYW